MKKKPRPRSDCTMCCFHLFLLYLFPSWLIPAMMAGNFLIGQSGVPSGGALAGGSTIRLHCGSGVILRIWLFGFAADILGALLNFCVYVLLA